ncbi:pyridoxamine 5'-phosphate oxidase family protein [Jatrophihabitans sp.]|uniref:pyridoxamine 5'-phosphate oxidase family protein n=1 Tax=Jatrophihabitans sp. TaxID=1932789 RepID=UPI0030C6EAD2|nr:pyridoxamine 5-phosphate oxidase-related FMN-binding protein [Jatrophihabitans sp.]
MSDELQDLLDRSFDTASEHLLSIMTPERRLSADRLLRELPCPAVLNIATVTAAGEPRVSAVDGHFLDGHWYFTTAAESPKARQLRARPAVSASYTPRDGFGVFCHGTAVPLEGAEQRMLSEHFAEVYGVPPESLGDITGFRIDAHWLVGFAMTDAEMIEIEQAAAERTARRNAERQQQA